MKKICLVLLTALMLILPVFAQEPDSHQTTLNYEVGESYTWQAPADITFLSNSNNDSQTGTVQVTSNVIGAGKKLVISIASNEDFLMTAATGSDTRAYKVFAGQTEKAAGASVLEVLAGTNTGSQELSFQLQSVAVQKAGVYSGTCNFSAAIANAS